MLTFQGYLEIQTKLASNVQLLLTRRRAWITDCFNPLTAGAAYIRVFIFY